jgi:hypothetical protein
MSVTHKLDARTDKVKVDNRVVRIEDRPGIVRR